MSASSVMLRVSQVFYTVLGLIELLLATRLILILIGSISESGFPGFVFRYSQYFVGPFQGTAPPSVFGRFVVEWDTLIAMLVYATGVFIFMKILRMIVPKSPDLIS